jgi:hypothetical protein
MRMVFDAQFTGEPRYDALGATGDRLMEALIDAGATTRSCPLTPGCAACWSRWW